MENILNILNLDINQDTFNAKVDIVTQPDNIKNYSLERNDYTELATVAIKNKASVIKFISPSYKDYPILCEEAIKKDIYTFLLIDDSVINYKELGIKSIIANPFIVTYLTKEKKHYFFFWELAISLCYKLLRGINEEKKDLFPLITKSINQEPLVIFFVDNRLSIYSELCNLAYSIDNESIRYMDINRVEENLVFEIIKIIPEKIRSLDNTKPFYMEACKCAVKLNGSLIRYVHITNLKDNLDFFFDLISIAEKSGEPEIVHNNLEVTHALLLENRRRKEKILSTPNILGNNLYKLLEDLDAEYKLLLEEHFKARHEALDNLSHNNELHNFIPECPIKIKSKKIQQNIE